MAEPQDSGSSFPSESSREESRTEFDMTPPPVPSVKRPMAKSTTPNLDFLRPGEAPGEIGRLGGYRILKVLGTGGMGVVFQAEDPNLKRMVALKVMKPLLAVHDNARKRFTREAQSAAAITHNHVVRIYQVGEDHGVPFLAMELLEGESLDTRLRREKRLPLAEALRITREVASGLAAAHRRGLVHRDIKPANIILEPVDPTLHLERTATTRSGENTPLSGVLSSAGLPPSADSATTPSSTEITPSPDTFSTTVKIVDFGLARATEDDAELTQSGHVTGTPQYMSPEQAEGHEIDPRSDLFSLGCVMYRMLAGETPFSGRSSSSLLLAIAERPHKPIRDHVPDVPQTVEKIIDRLLAKTPSDRFQSALELVQTLAELERRLGGGQLSGDSTAMPQATSSMTVHDLQVGRPNRPQSSTGADKRVVTAAMGLLCLLGAVMFWRSRDDRDSTNSIPHVVTADRANDKPAFITATKAKGTPPDHTDSAQPSVIAIPEVQPLVEWLQGREVLTVSQDGKGQFKTIQAALDALKPNQVVKVLDRGPYRESLLTVSLPKNTGLVSLVGTQLEVLEYRAGYKNKTGTTYFGVVLQPIDGFRLSGFDIRTNQVLPTDASELEFVKTMTVGPFIVDHCHLGIDQSSTNQRTPSRISTLTQLLEGTGQYTIRFSENDFRGAGIYLGQLKSDPNRRPLVQFDRNQIRDVFEGISVEPRPGLFDIQHNVIAAKRAIGLALRLGAKANEHLSAMSVNVSNNTIMADIPFYIYSAATRATSSGPSSIRNVRIHGNILKSTTDNRILFDAADDLCLDDLSSFRDVWQVSHNAYVGGKSLPLNFPTQPTDVELPESPLPYNADPSDENYLRPFANSRLAKAGTGAEQPSYIGALPPGSVPASGDWFSQLRSRWQESRSPVAQTDVDAEHRAAEWALRVGGTVKLRFPDDSVRPFSVAKDLPKDHFAVHSIDVHSNPRVTDDDVLAALAGLRELRSLTIHQTSITDRSLTPLRDSPSLSGLHLESTSVTDAGIEGLGTLPNLYHLQLNQTRVTEACVSRLVAQPMLKSLTIGSIPATQSAAAMLLKTSRWRHLGLHETWIQTDYVARLAELPDLDSLAIYGDLPVERLRLLSALPRLKTLGLIGNSLWSPEASVSLGSLAQLESLWLSGVRPSVGWAELAKARPWVSLNFFGTPVPDQFFDALDQTDSLVTLKLNMTTQSRSRLQRFRTEHPSVDVISDRSRQRDREVADRLVRLGGIAVELVDQTGSRVVRRADDLPDTDFKLCSIYVDECATFGDRILASLTDLDDLRILGLKGSAVTDAGLSYLDQLTRLQQVRLGAQHITPRGLEAVVRQRDLTGIALDFCTSASLQRLSPLTRLTFLAIEDSAAEESGEILTLIARQFPELAMLGLGKMILNPDAAKVLLNIPKLSFLTCQRQNLTPEVVAVLARHPSLQKMSLYGPSPQQWANLSPLLRIKELLIGAGGLTENDVSHLAELPQLQTLTFGRIKFTPESLTQTGKLRHVRVVNFRDCELSDAEWARVSESLPNSELLWNGKPRKLANATTSQ